ncbi:hypothetical protein Tco_0161653 [Tanacetum coccineum]
MTRCLQEVRHPKAKASIGVSFIPKAFSGTGGKGGKGKRNGVPRDVVVAFEDAVRVHGNDGETNSIGVRCSDSVAELESCRDEKAEPLFNSVPQQFLFECEVKWKDCKPADRENDGNVNHKASHEASNVMMSSWPYDLRERHQLSFSTTFYCPSSVAELAACLDKLHFPLALLVMEKYFNMYDLTNITSSLSHIKAELKSELCGSFRLIFLDVIPIFSLEYEHVAMNLTLQEQVDTISIFI